MGWCEQHPEQVTKPVTPPPPPPKTTVVREEVKDIIRAHREQHGVYPSIAEVTKESKRSRIVAEPSRCGYIEDTVAPQTFTFTKAQDKQVEARLKVLEAQFNERVRLTMLERNKDFIATLEQSKKEASEKAYHYGQMINNHNPIFTEEEFRDYLLYACIQTTLRQKKNETQHLRLYKQENCQLTGKK